MKLQRLLGALCAGLMLISLPSMAAEQATTVMPIAGPMNMATFAGKVNDAHRAMMSCSWGTVAPANGPAGAPIAYQCWADTSANPVLVKRYDGAQWVVEAALDATGHTWTPYRQGAAIAAVATSSSAADLTAGTLPAARLPNPTASTLGGTQSKTCSSSNWLSSVSTSGVPGCSQPSFSDLTGSIACSQLPALTGDVTRSAGSCVTVVANIPTATPVAGSLLVTNVTAPATPAAGKASTYVDSTDKRLHDKNDAGTVGTTVVASTCSSSNWFRTLSSAGVLGCSQPSFADLSSSLACSQTPALTGDVTTSAGSCATTIANGAVTNAKLASMAAYTLKGNATGSPAAPTDIDVTALTLKASPGASDIVLIQDASASNAYKKTTVGALGGASGTGTVTTAGSNLAMTGGGTTLNVEQMTPGGRLTIASGNCAPTTDQAAQTTVYYAPCLGQWVPIYNGTQMQLYQFTVSATDTVGLSLALGSNWAASTIYDAFIGLNASTVTLCTGTAWSNSGAGTSARGSGAGTTQLATYKGLLTNAVSMTCRNSNSTTFTCAVNQCTYVGSFMTNGSTGTVDLKFGTSAAGGGTACICIFNVYNQVWGRARVADTTASATYTTGTWQAYLANAGNSIKILSGAQSNGVTVVGSSMVVFVAANGSNAYVGVSQNSATPSEPDCSAVNTGVAATALVQTLVMTCQYAPALGYSVYYLVEKGDGVNANTFLGNLPSRQFISANFWW